MIKHNYHASNSHQFKVNGEALQLCAVYKKLLQVTPESVSVLQVNPYQVLQVTCAQNVYDTEIVAAF